MTSKNMKSMKVITIKQPWASLIVSGLKNIENRTWKTNFRGRVLIHAAKTPVKEGWSALNKDGLSVPLRQSIPCRLWKQQLV